MKTNSFRAAFSMFLLIFITTSAYSQWEQTDWPEGNSFFDLYANQDIVFARIWDSNNGGRTFFSDDEGINWAQVSSADIDNEILSIVMWDNNLLAGTWNGFYRSTLDGIFWEMEPFESNGIADDNDIWSVAIINNILLAGSRGSIYKSSIYDPNTWAEISTGIPEDAHITSIIKNGNTIFAGSDSNGVFIMKNNEESWAAINSGLADMHISQLVVTDTKLFAVTLNGVFVSDVNSTGYVSDTETDGMIWISDTNGTLWYADANGTDWTSDVDKTFWLPDNSGLLNINCLLHVNELLFAGTDCNGVYLSSDNGLTWIPIGPVMPDNIRVWSLAETSNKIFAGTSEGIWYINPADINNYKITAEASEGGTIWPDGEITIYENGSQNFTITPELGYRIDEVFVDGNSIGAVDTYTFSDVTASHTISATFLAVPIYTITSSAEEGGTISPEGEIKVSETWSKTFTITPSPGFSIASVIVDGNSVGTVSSYTFTDINENHTISVTFETTPFIITASAGTGGTISPSGEVEVWAGESQTFTITSSEGYEISDVLVDGVSVGAVSSYTFTLVTSNHTITALFNSLTVYQINCSGSDEPPFTADQYYSGGNTWSSSNAIDTTGVTDSAPEAVYQTLRWGGFTYILPNLTIGASYKVRLHFSEVREVAAYNRIFNVTINETTVLSNYNIYSAAGDINKAVVEEFTTTANTSGQIVIEFTVVSMQPAIAGIEIIKQ